MSSRPFPFNVSDLKTLTQLDRRLVDLTNGKRDFECPDVDQRLNGKRYKANNIEKTFSRNAQSIAMANFFKYTIVGGLAGWVLTSHRPQMKVISICAGINLIHTLYRFYTLFHSLSIN